ncbi:MAG: hypothetical protein J6V25_10545 [Oscillospiraceae bacterium]|nr:hypothetical protein [Oscillospiraceae bacterium]
MKKLITVLVVILILLGLGIAGAVGYLWYRENHIFVEDAVYAIDSETLDLRGQDISVEHYESVHGQLPGCRILWDVPFQGGKVSNDTTSLTVTTLSDEDILMMDYFPGLTSVDATGCSEYAQIEKLMAHRPGCKVTYQVSLGGKSFAPDTAQMVLENADYTYEDLLSNLAYLHQVTDIRLRMPELTQDQMDQLRQTYPDITFTCTVELLGAEYEMDVTELNLSAMSPADLDTVLQKLPLLTKVERIELMSADGTSQLSKTDVKRLMDAAPGVVINYTFDFYGYTVSTADEEVHIKNKKIGEEGLPEVRAALDIMTNCKRFVLENCQIPNEAMAQLRNDYRDKTKVVWRVSFGEGSTLTDAQVIRAVYKLVDDNCYNLIYCEDVRYMDLGHNEYLDNCDFVAGMPNLEYLILSGSPIKSLEPFRNCKKLKFLEIAFCGYIVDLSPLADCTSLQMLNISNTKAVDLSPLDNLPLTHFVARNNPSGKCIVPTDEQERFIQQHPDCWTSFDGAQPYGVGWRYEENEKDYLDYYLLLRKVFRYDLDPNIPNHVGWYLKDEEITYNQ